ncbi:fructosamine kinase family protein [Eupransor demetentiae]|uniref:Fructosamine-3-kinase (FN3K) n=1 Tax=Eupransor demetentiae TaxID=3109584 RepID=A0ABM9N4R8_9LACO|nr:Fructosamine-3-kinase (FN3K) [Lactobacillaceae bacterium LMG 33000]
MVVDRKNIVNQDFVSRLGLQDPHNLKSVSGGDINLAYSLYSGDLRLFLKVQPHHDASFFDSEVASLKALGQYVRVPEVIKQGELGDNAYLILSWIERGQGDQADLGKMMANLHSHHGQRFGFEISNTVDYVPKDNTWNDNWADFFIEQRLKPLMKQAQKKAFWLTQRGDHFANLIKTIQNDEHANSVKPSLLHGDFWGGNFMFDQSGQPVLYDPNAFYGDREYDIAVSTVFPGFNKDFYDAYQATYPMDEGWQDRMKWYEFYYVMMHFVRFGDIYAPRLNKLLISF